MGFMVAFAEDKVSQPELDTGLLVAAERYATGANIHAVNEAISNYKYAHRIYSESGWTPQREKMFYARQQTLRLLMAKIALGGK